MRPFKQILQLCSTIILISALLSCGNFMTSPPPVTSILLTTKLPAN